jgi:hypothetical protein
LIYLKTAFCSPRGRLESFLALQKQTKETIPMDDALKEILERERLEEDLLDLVDKAFEEACNKELKPAHISHIKRLVRQYYADTKVSYHAGPPESVEIIIPRRLTTLKKLKEMLVLNRPKIRPYACELQYWREMFNMVYIKAKRLSLNIPRMEKAFVVITPCENTDVSWDVDNFTISFVHNGLISSGFLRDDDRFSMRYLVQGEKSEPGLESYTKITIYNEHDISAGCCKNASCVWHHMTKSHNINSHNCKSGIDDNTNIC